MTIGKLILLLNVIWLFNQRRQDAVFQLRRIVRSLRMRYFTVDYNSCDDNTCVHITHTCVYLLFPSDESIIAGPMRLSGETGREEEDDTEEEVEEEQEGRL